MATSPEIDTYENAELGKLPASSRSDTKPNDNSDYEHLEFRKKKFTGSYIERMMSSNSWHFAAQFISTLLISVAMSMLVSYLIARSFRGRYIKRRE